MSTKPVINTRADLDALAGTTAHAEFIAHLKGTLTRTADVREYPAEYDRTLKPGDTGYLAPELGPVADDTAAVRFGFTREELLGLV